MKPENRTFVNAQEMHKYHPQTFYVPSVELLSKIKAGDSVKVCVSDERFWVTVTKVREDNITGEVDNDLVYSHRHGLHYKDTVTFKKENVYDILNANGNL